MDKLAGSKDLPRFYFAIGKDDFLYESYKTFKAHAKEIGFGEKKRRPALRVCSEAPGARFFVAQRSSGSWP